VDCYRGEAWDPARIYARAPLRVADIGTNAILLRAERDLLAMAGRFGTKQECSEIGARIDARQRAIGGLWHDATGLFVCRDLLTDAPIPVGTSAGFLPLFAGAASPAQAAAMALKLQDWAGRVRFLVPSTDPTDPKFESVRYWRGPIWAVVNWMIADGFAQSTQADAAARIRADTLALIETAGFSEYFDPTDGNGAGGGAFSWTAAIYLLLRA
jgi:glycogen debranching enzyme